MTFVFFGDLAKPTSLSKNLYNNIILDGNYLDTIDHPDTFLDFNYAERVANPAQIQVTLFLSPPLPILRDWMQLKPILPY